MSIQFISCNYIKENGAECPLCEEHQCRAKKILVDDEGKCATGRVGPYENKSQTENYVELTKCENQKCRHWELDEANQTGKCEIRTDIFFNRNGICNDFEKQIQEPGFFAHVPE